MDEIQENLEPQGTSRRTVMKGAAWAAPVVAVAAAVPMAAASPEPPEATFAFVGTTTSPKAGTNLNFRANGQSLVDGDYEDGAVLTQGELFTFTFANGATATGYGNLVGLEYVSGSIESGTIVFAVTADTANNVSVRFSNVTPAGGTISGGILGGSATATIR